MDRIDRDNNLWNINGIKKMATRTDHTSLYQNLISQPKSWNVLSKEEMEKLKRIAETLNK